jgi:hypothetical protein
MNSRFFHRVLMVLALLAGAVAARAQVVNVTASLDAASIPSGGSTTLRVFAQVIPAQQANASRIFSWYVDVLNTNGAMAAANYAAMARAASDRDPATSSSGTQDGANRRGIYDTFLNLPGAGVLAPVELMAIPVTGVSPGQTRFRVQAGTGAGLSSDFLVARNAGGPPLTGGIYSAAEAVLTVTGGAGSVHMSIGVTNAAGGNKGVTLVFPTSPGFNFTAQFRTNLLGTNWQSLPGAPHNAGAVFDLTPAPMKFYRVMISPSN